MSTAADIAIDAAKTQTKGIAQIAIDSIKTKWRKIDGVGSENTYRINLHDSVNTTKVLGNPKSINVENIYTDCYVFDRLSALRRFSGDLDDMDQQGLALQPQVERISAIEVARTGDNLFILGRPGAGKTTFLKYLAILACKKILKKHPYLSRLKSGAIPPFPYSPSLPNNSTNVDFQMPNHL